ncbi:hypothetical protein OG625_03555 [Streptomyces sp. NBC_01351]|uniref:hypothetical protein n=1 Tax=Streptomyces sp. NBC_01351 TaxID=2903833 RepID=UPI002E300E21|nr:hypothetical protein [Streptomyces sp. NBC_01351]
MTSTPDAGTPRPVPEDPDALTPDLPPTGPQAPDLPAAPAIDDEPEPQSEDAEGAEGTETTGEPTGPGNAPAQEPPD